MHVEILQENLSKQVGSIIRFVSNKSSLPILSCILIEAKENSLFLRTSSLDTAVELQISAKVLEPGVVAVPAKLFYEYIKSLHSGKLILTADKSQVTIVHEDVNGSISCIDYKDFPKTPEIAYPSSFVVELGTLSEIVNQVLFAASVDEVRPVLASLLIENSDDGVNFVATDGFRLSLLKVITDDVALDDASLLIPSKVFQEIERLVRDNNVPSLSIEYSVEEKSVRFLMEDMEITTRLVEGTYPQYQKIIPESSNYNVEIDRKECINALKTASLFARQNSNIVSLEFHPQEVYVSASASQLGKHTSTIAAKSEIETPIEVSFNSRYLLDILSHVSSDYVNISINGPLLPVVFKTDQENFLHVVMPIKRPGN